jgi:hypothetical protein
MNALWILCLSAVAADPPAASLAVSFGRDIRPLLADRCYTCHGPDAAQRKADLRLDDEMSAADVISAGDPTASEILLRLTSDDPDLKMPPPSSKLSVSAEEIDLIRHWIEQGASWERHWAFTPPVKSKVPDQSESTWPQNEIDRFVLQRLSSLKLKPTQPATKERWLRRVTFDLTGLPPTLAELNEFVGDDSRQAWETVVDRLLKSPAFGERLALEWLDVARYGDTDGLFEDHPRSIYPWRDWVVGAFNSNLPYNDFLAQQLSGDLMPDATNSQRIATGFIRNNPTSNEGGIIDEDYRIKYLVDRVNTTASSMLGLTLECAQCHDHKYDPMTQREYYQFAGFFNNLVGNGNTKGATDPTLRDYPPATVSRLSAIAGELAVATKKLMSSPPELTADFEKWLAELEQEVDWQPTQLVHSEALKADGDWWVGSKSIVPKAADEADSTKLTKAETTKVGQFIRVSLKPGQTGFLTISEVEIFVGTNNIALTGKATQSSVDYNSPATKAIDGNRNGSFASCSCTKQEPDAWWEVDLGAEFPIDSVAVWNRTDCCPERLDEITIQILDKSRAITSQRTLAKAGNRNALPADAKEVKVELESVKLRIASQPGQIAAFQWESRQPCIVHVDGLKLITGDKAVDVKFSAKMPLRLTNTAIILPLESAVEFKEGQVFEVTARISSSDGIRVRTTTNTTAATRAKLPKEHDKRLAFYRDQWGGFDTAREEKKRLEAEKSSLENSTPLTMIAADLPNARPNHMLIRGEYDQRGEVVETAALGSIMPFADDLPRNRLGLARWVTDRDNPLTSRVAVNRYWQMLFGVGIVKTSEDLGTQGDRPSQAELLDWLAVDFMESGWDTKSLIRKMVLSATYRQASFQTPELRELDPENRLLARTSRRRLSAEFIRDHALATSGLLVNKMGGPGVHPYQPAELFGANAIGSAGAKFTQGSGEDLYRRSLYTYWKRQIPAANLRILGADGRTKCRTRRESTNTPLQALVLLNDPQFVEAARALAERVIRAEPDDRLQFAFRLATSRPATDIESAILRQELEDRLAEFRADAERTKQYLAGGGARPVPADLDAAELAAYAAVSSLIMNLDESISY